MQLSEVPVYEITGADNEFVILKNGDKTTKRKFDDTPFISNSKCLLTEHGFIYLKDDAINFNNYRYKPGLLYVIADRVMHFTFDKFIMCVKKQQHTLSGYDEVKGNWLIKNSGEYMKIRHLGCCWRCSTNNEVIIDKQSIKCYDDNSIYFSFSIINFTDNKLTICNNLSLPDYKTMLKLDNIQRYKIISFTKTNVITNINTYDRQLFKEVNFTSEYIRTVKGFAEIANNKLIFGEKEILLNDIVYVGKVNNKVLHIFTKDKKYCCRTNKLYSPSHQIVDNPYLPWTIRVSDGFISHMKVCSECKTNDYLYIKNPNVINFTDDQIIIEHDSKTSIITLVVIPEGFKLVQQPYEQTQLAETAKPTETQTTFTEEQEIEIIKENLRNHNIVTSADKTCVVTYLTDRVGNIPYERIKEILIKLGELIETTETTETEIEKDRRETKFVIDCVNKSFIKIKENGFEIDPFAPIISSMGYKRVQEILKKLGLLTKPENKSKLEKEIAFVIDYLRTEHIKIIDGRVYISSRDNYDLLLSVGSIRQILIQLGYLTE